MSLEARWRGAANLLVMMLCGTMMNRTMAEDLPAQKLLNEKRPLVIAHRGYSGVAPENTIPAFELALAAGADLVELDYHHSSDGVPLVLHDYTLDRTTDADEQSSEKKIELKSRSAAELVKLDAGNWFNKRFAGTMVPTLEQALDVIQAGGVTLIERKAGDALTCARMLRAKNLVNRVIVQAFDWDYLMDLHKEAPEQILGALGPSANYNGKKLTDEEKVLSPEWVDLALATGAKAVVWNKNITREAVDYAHKKGAKVWVYTINDAGVANQLLDLGIDGIITDHPPVIWRALALRKQ